MREKYIILRNCSQKYLGIKWHNICNLLSTIRERDGEKEKEREVV